MTEPTTRCRADGNYCDRCDLLLGLEGLRVIAVERRGLGSRTVTVESPPGPVGCPGCGVLATGHGRAPVPLVDAPAMGRPVRLLWRKRRWRCAEGACEVVTFLEQDHTVALPRAKLTTRAAWWAIEQMRREHASVNGIRRQLGTSWRTVWETIKPLLQIESPRRVRRAYCWCQPACSRGSVRAYSSCSSSIGVRSSIELWMRSVLNHCTQSAVAAST